MKSHKEKKAKKKSNLVQYNTYKNNDIIKLLRNPEDKFPFQFGRGKAKLIAEHVDEIIAFANDGEDKSTKSKKKKRHREVDHEEEDEG